MKVAALGRTHWLHDSIRAVVDAGHEIVLVGTAPPAPEYRVGVVEFRALARSLGARFFSDPAIQRPRWHKLVESCGAEVAISVNWPTLIPESILGLFPSGVINAHAGDLPRFRGNAVMNWAILGGEEKAVLCLHRMVPELDAGPVIARASVPIRESTRIGDLYAWLSDAIPKLFVEALAGLAKRTPPQQQPDDPSQALRCYPRRPSDGCLDWMRSAVHLGRLVRASGEPFAGAYTYLEGPNGYRKIVVWRARVEALTMRTLGVPGQVIAIDRIKGEVRVLTGDGILVLEEVQEETGRPRRASDVILSTRDRLGLDVEAELRRLSRELARLRPRGRRR